MVDVGATEVTALITALGLGGALGQWAKSRWPGDSQAQLRAWTLDLLDRKERRDDALIERMQNELHQAESKIESLETKLEEAQTTIVYLREQVATLSAELRAATLPPGGGSS